MRRRTSRRTLASWKCSGSIDEPRRDPGCPGAPPRPSRKSTVPARASLVLLSLILVAAVANLNLAVANVALPDIGHPFDASQTPLNLVAVGYSLGLAASVLYLGAIGDRYGRKRYSCSSRAFGPAFCPRRRHPRIKVSRVLARVFRGRLAAWRTTTFALITALWSGAAGPRPLHCGRRSVGPSPRSGRCPGVAAEHFCWGAVFLITLPLASWRWRSPCLPVPSHVNEATDAGGEPRGHAVGRAGRALVLSITSPPSRQAGPRDRIGVGRLRRARGVLHRQRRAAFPLYDLGVTGAARCGPRRSQVSSSSAR